MAGAMPNSIAQQIKHHSMAMAGVMGLVVACCAGQEPSATYTVRGVVENSITHQPIARALVGLEGSGNDVLTDREGHFELSLTEGRYVITIRRPGYGQGMESRHAVKVDADTPMLTFSLTPEASIVGHVALSGGDDAEGLHIFIYMRRNIEGHVRWSRSGMATTDSEGDFRFLEQEAPAAYVLCNDPSPDDTRAITTGYPSICFPGGADIATAVSAPLMLSPGQQAEVEIALTRQRFYRVTIATANLRQGQGASMEIHSRGGPTSAAGIERSTQPGTVEADLSNGNYYVDEHLWGKPSSYGRVDFKVLDGPITGLTVNPVPMEPLMVEVHKDFTASSNNGSQATGGGSFVGSAKNVFDSSANDDNPGVNLDLIPADDLFGNESGGNLRRPEGSGESGLYEMDDVMPGRYWVRADTFGDYVSSITSGNTDLAREPLTVGQGGASAPIEITLRNDMGDIECTLNSPANGDGAGAGSGELKQVFAYAIPQFALPGRIPQAFGTTSGTYEFHNLAPGLYRVVAFDGRHEIDTEDANELARISAEGQTVTVEAGGTAQVEVNLIPSGEASASQ
jgi:hypothetical protein